MDAQNILNRVKEIRKEQDVRQANDLLKSGWYLLEIEQQIDGPYVTTYYILGRVEEVKESDKE